MNAKLRCTLFPGQFSSEYAVVVKSCHGRSFSLFAPRSDLDFASPPTDDQSVDGWLRVDVVKREKNLCVVRLPAATLENGSFLTVAADQLDRIATGAEAAIAP